MEYGAIDLHKKESQVRIVTDNGEIIDRRIVTTRDRFTAMFGGRPRMRLLMEASTESEWVAQHLEELGHEVIVADPNYAPMYGHRTRRVKTDRRDVAALTEACRLGVYRPAHRRSASQRAMQWHLTVREQLVRARTRSITLIRTAARMTGVHLRTGAAETFLSRVRVTELPAVVHETTAPLQDLIVMRNKQLAAADQFLAGVAQSDPTVRRLMTLPGVGPVTATAYVAALDDVTRFGGPGQATSYLGLVPQEIQFRRTPTPWLRWASGSPARPGAARASRLARLAIDASQYPSPPRMGSGDWSAARQTGSGCRAGPATGANSLRHVARRARLRPGANSCNSFEQIRGRTRQRDDGVSVTISQVVKLEERARQASMAARESRSTEGAGPPFESYDAPATMVALVERV
jgi:transposase